MYASLRRFPAIGFALLCATAPLRPCDAQAPEQKQVKYVRDAEEYAVLSRMVFRQALAAVTASVRERTARVSGPWAVVLDIDETVLDNSTFELDRASYGLPFENGAWNAWV